MRDTELLPSIEFL